ncbi:ParB-like nuclease domain-containing protein [Phyllobacterium sp. CL33Tsu]|nr:ParB-like nuclease domain-containing protein [Phyllobacterium sp. CL33Tsu]
MESVRSVEISLFQIDPELQMREAGIDVGMVTEYAEAMSDGAEFPPITVFHDGTHYWPGDGFHRIEANKKLGRETIKAEVRDGSKRDAILWAVGANASHGMRRTTADRRRSVLAMLRDPEWSKWSDREIGKRCAVDGKTVAKIRREITSAEFPQTRTFERNGKAVAMKIAQRTRSIEGVGSSMVERMLAKVTDSALLAECRRRGMELNRHEN